VVPERSYGHTNDTTVQLRPLTLIQDSYLFNHDTNVQTTKIYVTWIVGTCIMLTIQQLNTAQIQNINQNILYTTSNQGKSLTKISFKMWSD